MKNQGSKDTSWQHSHRCIYCDKKNIPDPARVKRHMLILFYNNGTFDVHGPIRNKTLLDVAIQGLKRVREMHHGKPKRWQFWRR